jgi:hypothetical protein
MAYDIHIARTKDWTDSASQPITKQDVDALIAADSELEWSTTDYIDMSDDKGVVTRYFLIKWKGAPVFWWYKDELRCSGPDEAQQFKFAQMARTLGALCVGDDNEQYVLKKGFFGGEKLQIIPDA